MTMHEYTVGAEKVWFMQIKIINNLFAKKNKKQSEQHVVVFSHLSQNLYMEHAHLEYD